MFHLDKETKEIQVLLPSSLLLLAVVVVLKMELLQMVEWKKKEKLNWLEDEHDNIVELVQDYLL